MIQRADRFYKKFFNGVNFLLMAAMCAVAMFLIASSTFAAKKVLDENLDTNTLKLMAQHGQLIHLAYDGEDLTYRTVIMLVDAPLDVVWSVITDIENYGKFIPEMLAPKIVSKKNDEVIAEHTVQVKIILGVSASEKYTTRYVFKKPRVYMNDPKKPKIEPGYWEVKPVDGGSKTLLLYTDHAPNLAEMGTMVKTVVRVKPELGLALQVSPVSILVKAMKNRSEELAKKK